MSPKPTSARKFLLNVPPPSSEVKEDVIYEKLCQNLIKKSAFKQQQTVESASASNNSLKGPEKRKLTSSNGPLSEIDPASDRIAAPVKKFKRPSCRSNSSTPNTVGPSSSPTTVKLPSSSSPQNAKILRDSPTKQSPNTSANDAPEKPITKDIIDILDVVYQSAKKNCASSVAAKRSTSPEVIRRNSNSIQTIRRSSSPTPIRKSSTSPKPHKRSFTPPQAVAPAQVNNTLPQANNISPKSPAIAQAADSTPVSFDKKGSGPIPPWTNLPTTSTNIAYSPVKTLQLPSPPHSVSAKNNSPTVAVKIPIQSKKLSKNQQKKNRQMKKKAAKAATTAHQDYPRNIEEDSFDSLFASYETATKSQQSKMPSGQHANNSTNAKQPNNNAPVNLHSNQSNQTVNHHGNQPNPAVNAVRNQHAGNIHNNYMASTSQLSMNQNGLKHDQNNTSVSVQINTQQKLNKNNHKQNNHQQNKALSSSAFKNKRSIEDIAREITGTPKPANRPNEDSTKQPNKHQKTKKPFVPLVTCRFFANGYCKDGDACTFKHDQADVIVKPNPKKNIVCEFFKTGSCFKMDACPYSHNLKLEPCKFFHLNNHCQNENCPYSHAPLDQEMRCKLQKLTGPCIFYHGKGVCNQGDFCLFSHEIINDDERRDVEKIIRPCTFFHLEGSCTKEECFFTHEEADPSLVAQLKKQHKLAQSQS